jgi:hypothetical protein
LLTQDNSIPMPNGGKVLAQGNGRAGMGLALTATAPSEGAGDVESRLRTLLGLALTIGSREGLLGRLQGQANSSPAETSQARSEG